LGELAVEGGKTALEKLGDKRDDKGSKSKRP
jgi:hypothetical protein